METARARTCWDQYGDSSSAASPSATAEEGGKETHISGAHDHRVSQEISMYSLLSHINYSKPTEVKASGRNGPATLDGRSLRSGTIVPLNGTRLPATSVPGSIRAMILQSGMDQSGLLRLQEI